MKTYKLKLTSALVIEGQVVRAGTTVEVAENYAKDFLRRGKAELVGSHGDQDAGDEPDLHRMKKDELLDIAQQMGLISVSDAMTKAEILDAIEAAAKED